MYKVPFPKIVKVFIKLGNDVHSFHKFAAFLGYLEIKQRATGTLKVLHKNYENLNVHFT